jgi:hypothetical protein
MLTFIDEALESEDEVRLVTDPNAPMYAGGTSISVS